MFLICHPRREGARRCPCGAFARAVHERLGPRRWRDLPALGRAAVLEHSPARVACRRCGRRRVERLPWAGPRQRETERLRRQLALDAASMPASHVALRAGVSWRAVRRAELELLERWERTLEGRPGPRALGVDEKYLGRRGKGGQRFVTVVSDLGSGAPLGFELGRDAAALQRLLARLPAEALARVEVVATDLHAPFAAAIRRHPRLARAVIVHDPFHVLQRANAALVELWRAALARGCAKGLGSTQGTSLALRTAPERLSAAARGRLARVLRHVPELGQAYTIAQRLRAALTHRDGRTLLRGFERALTELRRLEAPALVSLRRCLEQHAAGIRALARERPAVGRIEALNNNLELLVRLGRGHRDYGFLFRKLRFVVATAMYRDGGAARYRAAGVPLPPKGVGTVPRKRRAKAKPNTRGAPASASSAPATRKRPAKARRGR